HGPGGDRRVQPECDPGVHGCRVHRAGGIGHGGGDAYVARPSRHRTGGCRPGGDTNGLGGRPHRTGGADGGSGGRRAHRGGSSRRRRPGVDPDGRLGRLPERLGVHGDPGLRGSASALVTPLPPPSAAVPSPTSWGTNPWLHLRHWGRYLPQPAVGELIRVRPTGFLPHGTAVEWGSTAEGREGARAQRAGRGASAAS